MERVQRTGPQGTWRALGRDRKTCEQALASVEAGAGRSEALEAAVLLGNQRAWLKGGPLRGSAAWRYGLRRALLNVQAPRVRELVNLLWLRAHAFQAPAPLAAGTLELGLRARYQFLATELVEHAGHLEEWLPQAGLTERAQVLDELAREVGRMHALGFVHRDLYPRNVLVTPASAQVRRLVFLDAWRGGPRAGLRGPEYDLGCFMLAGASLLDGAEQRQLFHVYARTRAEHGRPLQLERFLQETATCRRHLVAQLAVEPHRWRGSRPPLVEWDPLALPPVAPGAPDLSPGSDSRGRGTTP